MTRYCRNAETEILGISTRVLAKTDKDETVSIDMSAKIAVAASCGPDDITEVNTNIKKGGENNGRQQ